MSSRSEGTYGGSARFGRRSSSTSPSFGGGIRFSGDHTLVGVFHGTTGLMSFVGGVVEAKRRVGMRYRHWHRAYGRARRIVVVSRGGGIMGMCEVGIAKS